MHLLRLQDMYTCHSMHVYFYTIYSTLIFCMCIISVDRYSHISTMRAKKQRTERGERGEIFQLMLHSQMPTRAKTRPGGIQKTSASTVSRTYMARTQVTEPLSTPNPGEFSEI